MIIQQAPTLEKDNTLQDYNTKLTELDNIHYFDLQAFMSEEGIKDFKKMMCSTYLNADTKVELLVSIFANPAFFKVPGYDNHPTQEKACIAMLCDILDMPSINSLATAKLINAISNSNSKQITEYIKKIALNVPDISNILKEIFKDNPEEGIELLTEYNTKELFTRSQNDIDLLNLIKAIGKYLENPNSPLESKVKLFCATIKNLCNNVAPNSPLAPHYHDVFISYFKFFQDNWQQEYVRAFLYESWVEFTEHFSKIPSFTLETIPESTINKMLEDQKDLEANGFLEYSKIFNSLILVSLKKEFPEYKEKKLNAVLPLLHKQNLETFCKMIVTENKGKEIPLVLPSLEERLDKIIYNQEGYDEGVTFIKGFYKGAPVYQGTPLALKDGTPIGYNIHLPKGEVKGVFVQAYGGFREKDRMKKLFSPGALSDLELDLFNKGYAIVTLNLVDMLKLNLPQGIMPKDLHTTLHASIHQFYDTLKNQPHIFDPSLHILKDKKLFLYGGSFGGRTAIRHAELFPKTFDGYISFDGGLSFGMIPKSDTRLVGERYANLPGAIEAAKWLDPITEIDRISDCILLLHNLDDNNVNLKVTLDWYKKAKKAGKQDLIQLHITEKGSPVLEHDLANTGHFPTKEATGFNTMTQVIASFMENGPQLSAISEWHAHRYNIIANKNYRSATFEKRFVSEAYRLYRDVQSNAPISDQNWKTHYVPLYYSMHYLVLQNNPYKCREEMKKLKSAGRLTPEIISRSLESYLSAFLTFIKEKDDLLALNDLDIKQLSNNPNLQEEYVRCLTQDIVNVRFLMSTLYKANPELLKEHYAKYDNDPTLQTALHKAHTKLNTKIEKEKNFILKAWQQTVKSVRDKKMIYQQGICVSCKNP